MRKIIIGLTVVIAALFFGCNKSDITANNSIDDSQMLRACATMDVLNAQIEADPGLADRMLAIDKFTEEAIRSGQAFRLVNGVIEIPVVVNVLYKTTSENISQAQIQSQIDVLNEDFNATNADTTLIPSAFAGVKAKYGIRFVLDLVVRKATNKKSWGTNDAMKKSSLGGISPTSPTTKLNIWVCTLGQNLLGYAQFPGGNSATDGVVCLNTAFGRTGTARAPYGLGRTTTHEVGHWMNLRHIWGDAACGNDQVNDTPVAHGANYGCPSYPFYGSCSTTLPEMTMNYMDYTYDACMYMFTNGQKAKSLAIFAAGGPRAAFAQ